jgi:hypothetical protein
MRCRNRKCHAERRAFLLCAALFLLCMHGTSLAQQSQAPAGSGVALPESPGAVIAEGTVGGVITDTDGASIPKAHIALENVVTKVSRSVVTDDEGSYSFAGVSPGKYVIRIVAHGFSSWKVENVEVHAGEVISLKTVELGVEALTSAVDAITMEDLAEQQITAEEHQRILGILPNFFVSYVPHAAPLTKKQKFKLALVVSRDPLTFFTTGVSAGIEQWQGDFAGYGQEFSGYAKRYGAAYADRVDATFLGAAVLPSLLHQDPRYFYMGHGNVVKRALYAISTTVVCKGDNGKRQPNYSNVFGNLGAAGISSLYYPDEAKHDVQVTVVNTLLGVAEGAIGTLFQEFLLKHLTHGAPKQP